MLFRSRTRPPGVFPTTIHGKYDIEKKDGREMNRNLNLKLEIIGANDINLLWKYVMIMIISDL